MDDQSEIKSLQEFIHENIEMEELEKIANQFNIFNALDLVKYELKHSKFLAWLLNPIETHGLGDYCLSLFLKKVSVKASALGLEGPSIFDIEKMTLENSEVLTEKEKIDITIICQSHEFICTIENKIYANESHGQLLRYREVIEKEYPNYLKSFVYLTIDGIDGAEKGYVPLSYNEILQIIEYILDNKKDKCGLDVLTFIKHYKDMLRRNIMNDSKIQELCRIIYTKHRKALDLIFLNKPDNMLETSNYMVEILKGIHGIILDESNKSRIRFIPEALDRLIPKKGDGWTKTKRILLFELLNREDAVDLYLIIGPGPNDIRKKIYNIVRNNLKVFNKASRNLTNTWFTIYKKSLIRKS